ncbi:MAG: hypothetical protein J6Q25_05275 [Bacteroidales bacterium]|nr:hypothetical protein [Bacteroidales bacterium]
MATVKVKFRPSKVEGKKGVIYYQIIHRRKTVHISTKYRIYSQDWDEETLAIFPFPGHFPLCNIVWMPSLMESVLKKFTIFKIFYRILRTN